MDRLQTISIALIGAGAMGEAIISGMLRQQLVQPDQITAVEPRPDQRDRLQTTYTIATSDNAAEVAQASNVIIFAVKPQILPQVLPTLQQTLHPDSLGISIAAGVPISLVATMLAHPAIVRAMPNTPAQIGAGMTVWTASSSVTDQQREWARLILGALGEQHYVDYEQQLDMATAINGSGPAYFFLIMEAMIDAGVHMGFSRPVAEQLVLQTMYGAVAYVQQTGQHPALLRNAVTSPGGTTAAALSMLEQEGLRSTLSKAIWAAYERSCELGKKT
jgi:pyrroline-5-carboxylate reductase